MRGCNCQGVIMDVHALSMQPEYAAQSCKIFNAFVRVLFADSIDNGKRFPQENVGYFVNCLLCLPP